MTIATGQDILAADVLALGSGNDVNILSSLPPLSGLQAAPLSFVESSGAGTIKPIIPILSFDDTTDEGRMWVFRAPSTTLYLHYAGYMAGANTSKTVCIAVQLAAVSPGDTGVTAKVFDTVNTATKTVPDDAGTEFDDTITLTNGDSVAVGDWVCMNVFRDVSADDAAGDFNMSLINIQVSA